MRMSVTEWRVLDSTRRQLASAHDDAVMLTQLGGQRRLLAVYASACRQLGRPRLARYMCWSARCNSVAGSVVSDCWMEVLIPTAAVSCTW